MSDEEVDDLDERLFPNNERDGPSNYSLFSETARKEREFSDLLSHFINVNRCNGNIKPNASIRAIRCNIGKMSPF